MSGCEILRVDAIDCDIEPYRWAYAETHDAAIRAHWAELAARKASVFDGRVLMMHRHAIERGVLRGSCFETAYSRFIAWRDFGCVDYSVRNVFGMAALRAADGAFLVGEMGAHTASAGKVYFPAGTPDLSDVRDGRLDLDGSVLRELEEETGLSPGAVAVVPGWTLVMPEPRIACMREVVLDKRADEAAASINATLASQQDPELSAVHVVRNAVEALRYDMPDFMFAYLRHAFGA
jgi:8-oxo-dGTP pyrophosphatase MutT (NUDIX family)